MKHFHNCTSQEDKTLNQLLTCKKLTHMPTPMLQTGILGLDLTRHLLHLLKLSMHLTSNPGHKRGKDKNLCLIFLTWQSSQ